jgi:hypothetical protein
MTAANMEKERALKIGLFSFSKAVVPLGQVPDKRPPAENQCVRFNGIVKFAG